MCSDDQYVSLTRYFETRIASGGDWCRVEVARARRKGLLPPPREFKCEDCAAQASEYDHRDYGKPLLVAPVCRGCNRRRGRAIPHPDPLMMVRRYVTSKLFMTELYIYRAHPLTAADPWRVISEPYREFAVACFMSAKPKKMRFYYTRQFADALHGAGTSVHEVIGHRFERPCNHLSTGAASSASSSQLVTT
jgi:hypothetical protein